MRRSQMVRAVVICVCIVASIAMSSSHSDTWDSSRVKMRGVCWVAGDSIASHNIDDLSSNHIQWISQTPFAYQRDYNKPSIRFGEDHWCWGERAEGIIHTSRLAEQAGIYSILKPHIWLRTAGGKWRADIQMTSADDWDAWFCNYEEFILHFARVAEIAGVKILCIGTELYYPSTLFPDRWRALVREIRQEFSGELTYAANFHREFEEITWWDDLDYIGVQAYFPLTESDYTNVDVLSEGWETHIRTLKKISKTYDKPVIFTELGYRNDPLAAIEPWLWPSQVDTRTYSVDDAAQVQCYKAFFESCWNEDWLAGVFIWKWFHGTYRFPTYEEYLKPIHHRRDSLYAIGERRTPSTNRVVFSPQGKPAQDVLRHYFSKR